MKTRVAGLGQGFSLDEAGAGLAALAGLGAAVLLDDDDDNSDDDDDDTVDLSRNPSRSRSRTNRRAFSTLLWMTTVLLGSLTGNEGGLGAITGSEGLLGSMIGSDGLLGAVTGEEGLLGGCWAQVCSVTAQAPMILCPA